VRVTVHPALKPLAQHALRMLQQNPEGLGGITRYVCEEWNCRYTEDFDPRRGT
jgi:hypothetical protein